MLNCGIVFDSGALNLKLQTFWDRDFSCLLCASPIPDIACLNTVISQVFKLVISSRSLSLVLVINESQDTYIIDCRI